MYMIFSNQFYKAVIVLLSVLFFFGLFSAVYADYEVTFDNPGEEDGGYATAIVNLSGLDWQIGPSAMIGNQAGDEKTDFRAARIRLDSGIYGSITMLEDKVGGLGTLSFNASRANFSGDRTGTAPIFEVQYSLDGFSTFDVIDTINLSGIDTLTAYQYEINEAGDNGRIRFIQTGGASGKRWNVDDIIITDFIPVDLALDTQLTQSGTILAGDNATYEYTITNLDTTSSFDVDAGGLVLIGAVDETIQMPASIGDPIPTSDPNVECTYFGPSDDPNVTNELGNWIASYSDTNVFFCEIENIGMIAPQSSYSFTIDFNAVDDFVYGTTNPFLLLTESPAESDSMTIFDAFDNGDDLFALNINNTSSVEYAPVTIDLALESEISTTGPINAGDMITYTYNITNLDTTESFDSDINGLGVLNIISQDIQMPASIGDPIPTSDPNVECEYFGATTDIDAINQFGNWISQYPGNSVVDCSLSTIGLLDPQSTYTFTINLNAQNDLILGNTNTSVVYAFYSDFGAEVDGPAIAMAAQNEDDLLALDINNISFAEYSYTASTSTSSKRSGSIRFICADPKASNYSDTKFGRHDSARCEYDEIQYTPLLESSVQNPFGGEMCSSEMIVTDNMKNGDKNGQYSVYNQGLVTQVDILQQHINRLLLDEYGNQASGPVDGIFGPLTKRGVERLQQRLNQLLPDMKPLVIDGIVGPFTKEAINMSC